MIKMKIIRRKRRLKQKEERENVDDNDDSDTSYGGPTCAFLGVTGGCMWCERREGKGDKNTPVVSCWSPAPSADWSN